MIKPRFKRRMSVWRYLSLGYFLTILIGAILLILPISSSSGEMTNFLDALFTATSATCVTGLIVYETGVHWSVFGQVVILLLIQLGGLGFMAFVSIVILLIRRGLSLYERTAIKESFGSEEFGGVKRVIKWIFLGTFLFELLGALLLMIRFIPDFGVGKGIWYSVWHAVSAFCNAGFDILGAEFQSEVSVSLVPYAKDPLVSLVIPFLIIMGGLGYCVWGDVIKSKGNVKKMHFYTKVALSVTLILLVSSTGLLFLFERDNPTWATYTWGEKLLCSFFQATTTRTAGFFTTDPSTLSDSGFLLSIILMFIGGASGSTAGGIKVTTFAVLVMGMLSTARGLKDTELGSRRLDPSLLSRALAIVSSVLTLIIVSVLVLCAIEPDGPDTFRMFLFEVVSAMGTVGLSMGITSGLGIASKIILIVLMYIGRVGVLTFAMALGAKRESKGIQKPVSSLFIG